MTTKNIYLVRHGETTSNLKRTWRTADERLTRRGIDQAHTVGERIKSLAVERIISSTASRTMETAEIISQVTDLPLESDELFYAEKTPSSIQGLLHEPKPDNVIEQYLQAAVEHSEEPEWRYENEENLYERKLRVKKIIDFFDTQPDDELLIVTHGNIMKMVAAYLILGEDCTAKSLHFGSERLRTSNTGITQLFKDNSQWRIHMWNDHAHFAE